MDLPRTDAAPRRQLSEDVAAYVRELIISGRVRQGDFLRIDAIAKAMGISSTPVREGLLLLQIEGFVKLAPRRGFQVVGFSRQDVRDIFWAQAVLAGELAARAADSMSEADLEDLARLDAEHRDAVAIGNETQHTRLAHGFHRAINLSSGSRRLAVMLGTMTKQLPNQFYGMAEGQIEGALDYHALILQALAARDSTEARRLMVDHIVSGGELLVAHLEGQGIWDTKADVS